MNQDSLKESTAACFRQTMNLDADLHVEHIYISLQELLTSCFQNYLKALPFKLLRLYPLLSLLGRFQHMKVKVSLEPQCRATRM